jgi:hypothetical protein
MVLLGDMIKASGMSKRMLVQNMLDIIVLIDFHAAIDEQKEQLTSVGNDVPNHHLGHILEQVYD